MGDFNINLLRFDNCKYAQNFILSLQSFNVTPTIDKPTRVHHNSYSLIDNIFASNLEDIIASGNIISDLTDHFLQFCILNPSNDLDLRSKKCYPVTSLIIQRQNILNELSQLDLVGAVSGLNDLNKSFSVFYNKLLSKHAPFKPISKRKKKSFFKPWVTKGIRKSIKIKNNLYCSGDTTTYKLYLNKVLTLTRISKKMYFRKYFEENFTNTQKIWEGINSLLGRKNKAHKV